LWIHAASMAEPTEPDRRRHAGFGRGVLGHHPRSNGRPEPDPVLPPGHRRPSRRGNLTPIATNLQLSLPVPVAHLRKIEVLRRPVESAQFRSRKFVHALAPYDMVGSMGRVGAAGDNAAMESFFSLLQKNILDRRRWDTREELRIAIVTWIERTISAADAKPRSGG
jgi:putative transposase